MAQVGSVAPAFLLSLPRSGSTLVQRVLAGHAEVATAPEPWVALPPLLALDPDAAEGSYDHATLAQAVVEFRDRLPGGQASYDRAVRAFLLELYAAASSDVAGSRWFLDKTPRYALVASHLARVFPDAPLLVLWRNPLAVVASMTATWHGGRWFPMRHGIDLFDGLARLVELATSHPDRVTAVRYEDLVVDPSAWRPVTDRLAIEVPAGALDDVAVLQADASVGDPTQARYGGVSSAPVDKWRRELASPVRLRWCRRYLDWIGPDRLAVMGYDHSDLHTQLDALDIDPARAAADAWDSARERGRAAVRRWQAGGEAAFEWSPGRVPW